jgi:hypothetical protein
MQRLEAMIDQEWNLLLTQVPSSLVSQIRLFCFADTVSARNFAGTNECHGWLGNPLSGYPARGANDLLLHLSTTRSFHGINVSTGTIDSAHPTFYRAKIARC